MKTKALFIGGLLGGVSSWVAAHPAYTVAGDHEHGLLHPYVGVEQLLLYVAAGVAVYLLSRGARARRDREG